MGCQSVWDRQQTSVLGVCFNSNIRSLSSTQQFRFTKHVFTNQEQSNLFLYSIFSQIALCCKICRVGHPNLEHSIPSDIQAGPTGIVSSMVYLDQLNMLYFQIPKILRHVFIGSVLSRCPKIPKSGFIWMLVILKKLICSFLIWLCGRWIWTSPSFQSISKKM